GRFSLSEAFLFLEEGAVPGPGPGVLRSGGPIPGFPLVGTRGTHLPGIRGSESMSGDTSNDPFVAYQKAAKSMSAKKGSASRTVSGDDLMITGSRQATMVKIEPSLEKLKNQLSEEKTQRLARELEIRDLKDKINDVERSAEISSADTLSVGKKNQELEEAMENLRLETVMAVSGAIITARWELMREWLQRKNDQ
ncbi:unnamed protein product, partial [Brassica rapa]